MSQIRKRSVTGLRQGDTFVISRTFHESDTVAFADISGDYNPVHFDERFAKAFNMRGRICHGLLVASLLTEVGGQIGWLASQMNYRFRKPVYFGDTITCTFTVTELDERNRARGDVVFTNQQGETVIEAYVTGLVPGTAAKAVIEAMIAEGDSTNKRGSDAP